MALPDSPFRRLQPDLPAQPRARRNHRRRHGGRACRLDDHLREGDAHHRRHGHGVPGVDRGTLTAGAAGLAGDGTILGYALRSRTASVGIVPKLWRGEEIARSSRQVVSISVDSGRVAVLRDSGVVTILTRGGRPVATVRVGAARAISLRPGTLAVLTRRGTLDVYETAAGKKIHSWRVAAKAASLDLHYGIALVTAGREVYAVNVETRPDGEADARSNPGLGGARGAGSGHPVQHRGARARSLRAHDPDRGAHSLTPCGVGRLKLTRRQLVGAAAATAAGAAGVYELLDRLAEKPARPEVLGPPPNEQHVLEGVEVVVDEGVEVLVPPLHHRVVTARVTVDETRRAASCAAVARASSRRTRGRVSRRHRTASPSPSPGACRTSGATFRASHAARSRSTSGRAPSAGERYACSRTPAASQATPRRRSSRATTWRCSCAATTSSRSTLPSGDCSTSCPGSSRSRASGTASSEEALAGSAASPSGWRRPPEFRAAS